jgi:hypothetical protein
VFYRKSFELGRNKAKFFFALIILPQEGYNELVIYDKIDEGKRGLFYEQYGCQKSCFL